MAKITSRKYSNKKLKLFLFFLSIAGIFWILTKFSRDFTAPMVAKINYVNLPETAALAQDNLHELNYDLTANGFEIIFYKIKKPALEVDVSKYYEENAEGFTISKNELMGQLALNFNKYMEVKDLPEDGLQVNLDPIVLKKVKVATRLDIGFKEGFKAIDSFIINPDSVTISGPKGILEQIDSVNTEILSMQNVGRSISETLAIVSPSDEIVRIKPSRIKMEWAVAEFSQGKFTLPVEVINLPPGTELKLVPEKISVSFDIPVEDFSEVSLRNFRIVCDYSTRNMEENFMLPVLAKKPQAAVNVVMEPKKVDFFIFK